MTTKPLLCLVTDRRRLAAAVGRPAGDAIPLLWSQLEGAVHAGVDLVQIRERDLEGGALARVVEEAMRIAVGSPTRVLINDRVDVAIAAGADGAHLREAGVPSFLVRRRWPAITIGRSVHSKEGLARVDGADYLIAGTMFPTESKPSARHLGVEGLSEIVRLAHETPVLAIGGMTLARFPLVVRAGARGVAAVGLFLPDSGARNVADAVAKTVKTARFAFDTASTVS